MNPHHLLATLLLTAASAALAQTPAPAVKESTDPARAAAVERAAAALKARPPQAPVGLVRALTAGGHALLSGGITAGDRATMQAERERYSLWIATVAKPSGAYLADADLRVTDLKSKKPVLERRMEGPWLMLALPAGAYEVQATFRDAAAGPGQKLTSKVSVPAKGKRQAVLRFDSKATVGPEMQNTEANPFGQPQKRKP